MRRKTAEEYREEVYNLVGDEYEIIEDYILSSVPTEMKHTLCNHVYKVRPNLFLKGGRCPNCNGNDAKRKTTEQFKEEVMALVGDEYTVLGDYVARDINIKIRHNVCNREYFVEPGNFLHKSRCIECHHNSLRLTQAEVESKFRDAIGEHYQLVSEYHSMQTKVTMKHTLCGNTFEVRPTDIIYKASGCTVCVQSKGEDFISEYLKSRGIRYIAQKKFDDLKNIFQLPYDFYLPQYNTLIEYQGSQHFYPKTFGGMPKELAEANLVSQKHRDKLKKEYADKNGYTLWEPTYKLNTYSKVEEYLNKQFALLEVTQGTLNQN